MSKWTCPFCRERNNDSIAKCRCGFTHSRARPKTDGRTESGKDFAAGSDSPAPVPAGFTAETGSGPVSESSRTYEFSNPRGKLIACLFVSAFSGVSAFLFIEEGLQFFSIIILAAGVVLCLGIMLRRSVLVVDQEGVRLEEFIGRRKRMFSRKNAIRWKDIEDISSIVRPDIGHGVQFMSRTGKSIFVREVLKPAEWSDLCAVVERVGNNQGIKVDISSVGVPADPTDMETPAPRRTGKGVLIIAGALLLFIGGTVIFAQFMKPAAMLIAERRFLAEEAPSDAGASTNAQQITAQTESPLQAVLQRGRLDEVRAILDQAGSAGLTDADKRASLLATSYYDAPENNEIVRLLVKAGADVNASRESGLTPLILAVGSRNIELTVYLLKKGAAVNVNSDWGSPLAVAADKDDAVIALMLLQHKADPNLSGRNDNSCDRLPIQIAMKHYNKKLVAALLKRGADPDRTDGCGRTPLFTAVDTGDAESLDLLISRKANLNLTDLSGSSALIHSVKRRRRDMAERLILARADVNLQDHHGWTALMYAAQWGDPAMLQDMIRAGARIDVRTGEGISALSIAEYNGKTDAIAVLKHAGAKD